MNNELELISENYKKYLQVCRDTGGAISVDDQDGPFALQNAYHAENVRSVQIKNVNINGNNQFLIEEQNKLPSIDKLTNETLKELPVHLTDILKQAVTTDHIEYWKFTLDVVSENVFEVDLPSDVRNSFEVLLSAILCDSWQASGPARVVLENASIFAAFLSYSILEAVLKLLCEDEIQRDGRIRPGVEVLSLNGENYSQNNNRTRCNRFSDLLYHIECKKSAEPLRDRMIRMRGKIQDFRKEDTAKIYGSLQRDRNIAIHGQERAEAEYGIVLNLICLLLWNSESVGHT